MPEFLIVGIMVLAVMYIAAHYHNDTIPSSPRPYYVPVQVEVQPQPKRRRATPKRKAGLNDMQKLAKDTLVTMGYTATEAKKLLMEVHASTPEQYVQEVMKRVKI